MRFHGLVGLTRIVVSIVAVGCALPFLAAEDGGVDPSAASLEKSLEVMHKDSEARSTLRIVVEGDLGQAVGNV